MTVEEFVKLKKSNGLSFCQYYGTSEIGDRSDGEITDALVYSTIQDILFEENSHCFDLDEESVREEVESLRPSILKMVSIAREVGFDENKLSSVDDKRFREAFPTMTFGDHHIAFSKNRLLYLRPCQFSIRPDGIDRIEIEFND